MRISKIHLKGWRSYSLEEGISIDGLKHINVIIGPNNAGKSNLFKYLFHLREMVRNTPTQAAKKAKSNQNIYDTYNSMMAAFSEEDTWAEENKDITCDIVIDDVHSELDASFHQSKPTITLHADHKNSNKQSCLSVVYNDNFYLLEPFSAKPKIYDPDKNVYVEPKEGVGFANETYSYWFSFINSLVFVDPIRHYSRETASNKECDFDGSDIITRIIDLQNNNANEWRTYKQNIQAWVKSVLSEELFEIEATKTGLRFYLRRGERDIAATLSQLGTGVSQLIMLLSYLYLYKDNKLNVFIEEPEGNLHPEAVVQLIRIIKQNFINHRFFITTHSSILIDQLDSEWSVHRIMRKENQSSVVQPCNTIVQHYEVLDELGIRASQLLQTNLIIWIEGPSDRTYINKWIQDHSSEGVNLIEGRHYSFLMYGGSNLANLDILCDDENINILRTSRYAVVVCDSDKTTSNSELKDRVKKLINKINSKHIDENGHERNLTDYIYVWVTEGREIENYIPHQLLLNVLNSDEHTRKRVKVGNSMRNVVIDSSNLGNTQFGQYDSFDEYFSKIYRYEDGNPLDADQSAKISSDFSKNKASIAKSVVRNWDKDVHYASIDLQRNIANLIERIKIANGLKY